MPRLREGFFENLKLAPEPETHFVTGYLLGWQRHATLIADGQLTRKWNTR